MANFLQQCLNRPVSLAHLKLPSNLFLLIALVLLVFKPAAAVVHGDASFPVFEVSTTDSGRIEVGSRMGVLVDTFRTMGEENAPPIDQEWQTITRRSPNFGFTDDAYWFRFQIVNLEKHPLSRFIELAVPFINDVKLYHYKDGMLVKHYSLGNQQPFAQRPIRHRNFVIPVHLAPGPNAIYMRLRSNGTIEAPLRIWDPEQFYAASSDESLAQGAVIGILLIMIAYNLFLLFATRDINYLYYVGFVANYMCFHLSLTGYMFAYVWPNAVYWNSFAISTFMASTGLFSALFCNSFLRLSTFSMPAYYVMRVLILLSAGLLLLTFFLPYSLTVRLGAGIAFPVIAVTLVLGYWRWWSGAQFARFYCMAWTAILIALAVLNANKHGWIPLNIWTENASEIGIVLLVLLLSLTLADRINNDRMLKLNAQAVALASERKARAIQQALFKVTSDTNRELEQRVQSRTTDLNATLEQLKEANERLQLLSTTDGLTQIRNRAYFNTAVMAELSRAKRMKTALTIILFDIDHFKRINDTCGHLAGDACLRALADLLRPRIQRPGDILARYGGEEFVVVLVGVDQPHAMTLAEDFRVAIERLQVNVDGGILSFTASFGVISVIPDATMQLQDILSAADKALYLAKHEGRNCVRAAEFSL